MRMMLTLLGVLLLLSIWQMAAALVDSFLLPGPWHTVQDTLRLLVHPHTWQQIGISLARVLIAFVLAFCCGTATGVLIGSRQELEMISRPIILIIQGIPPILWTIPLIVILGAHPTTPIVVIALICFPLITLTIASGMKSVPKKLTEMLKVFAPGVRAQLKEVILPHLRPFFMAALSLGLMLGIKASVIAEYFGAGNGIGFQIQAAYQSLLIRRIFAWGLLFVVLILVCDALLKRLESLSLSRPRRKAGAPAKSSGLRRGESETLQHLFLSPQPQPPIQLDAVSFHYPDQVEILRDVSLTVQSPEIVIISGDSGVGKTTLLNIIASLLTPVSGRIVLPQSVGYIFQDDRFLPWRTNEWNVALPLVYQGCSPAGALEFARYLLYEAGLAGKEMSWPDELSGGMKKRLALARCFARLPQSILMDEPFSGLHKEARELLWKKFFDLLRLRPVPVIIVTHFPEEIMPPPHGSWSVCSRNGLPAGAISGLATGTCRWFTLKGSPATLRASDSRRKNNWSME